MRVTQAFRFELAPNRAARVALAKHVGAARFAYNWGLSVCLMALERKGKIPSAFELHKAWNAWKRDGAPWWVEVSKCAPQEAFRDLERAFRNWRQGRAGKPRFKCKKIFLDNTARVTGSIRVCPRHVRLPRIGTVRTKERTDKFLALREAHKVRIFSATLSREADRWYVSLACEVERPDPTPKEVRSDHDIVGVDLGLSAFAVLSDGTRIEAPTPLAKRLTLLKRRSRRFSRKQKGSHNQKKAALALARLHRRVKNLRRDFLHKVTTWLAKTKPALVVEDLNVRGLSRGRLSRSVADVGWGDFRRMLEYKSKWYGSQLIVVPRSFPSTRLCSRCGHLHGRMPLPQRVFWCEACGLEMDRDVNAALNLRSWGLVHLMGPTGSSPGSHACRDSSGGGTVPQWDWSTSHGSRKQEVAGHLRRLQR